MSIIARTTRLETKIILALPLAKLPSKVAAKHPKNKAVAQITLSGQIVVEIELIKSNFSAAKKRIKNTKGSAKIKLKYASNFLLSNLNTKYKPIKIMVKI